MNREALLRKISSWISFRSQRYHKARKADFSHLPAEMLTTYIELKMKEQLSDEDLQELADIERHIRYKPQSRAQHVSKPPRGRNESAEAYLKRVVK